MGVSQIILKVGQPKIIFIFSTNFYVIFCFSQYA